MNVIKNNNNDVTLPNVSVLPDSVPERQSNFSVDSLQNLCSRSHQYMYQYGIYLTVKSIENA